MNYPDLENLPDVLKQIVAGKRNANVYKMLMHSPNVAPGFTAMADAVMWPKTWPATLREIAIVRVGHLYSAPYEVNAHNQIGRFVGLTDAKLDACALGADQASLEEDERAILRLTDALVAKHTLAPAERDEGIALLGINGFADFVLTVGFYQLVSNFLNTFEVQVEDEPLFPKK